MSGEGGGIAAFADTRGEESYPARNAKVVVSAAGRFLLSFPSAIWKKSATASLWAVTLCLCPFFARTRDARHTPREKTGENLTQPHFVAEPGTGVHRALAGSTARGARAPRSRSEHRALRVYGRRLPNARRRSLPPESQREPETQPWLDRRAKLVVQEAPHRPLLRAEAPAPARVRAGRATGGRARAVHRPVPARDGQGAPAPRSRPHSRPRIPLGHKKRERRHRQTVRIAAISGLLFFSFRQTSFVARAPTSPRVFSFPDTLSPLPSKPRRTSRTSWKNAATSTTPSASSRRCV